MYLFCVDVGGVRDHVASELCTHTLFGVEPVNEASRQPNVRSLFESMNVAYFCPWCTHSVTTTCSSLTTVHTEDVNKIKIVFNCQLY